MLKSGGKSMKPNAAVVEQRIKDFDNRADVRNLLILAVGGLISTFDLVDKLAELALEAGIDKPIRMN